MKGWRAGLVVWSSYFSCGGPGFCFQPMSSGIQPSLTLALWDVTPKIKKINEIKRIHIKDWGGHTQSDHFTSADLLWSLWFKLRWFLYVALFFLQDWNVIWARCCVLEIPVLRRLEEEEDEIFHTSLRDPVRLSQNSVENIRHLCDR